MLNTSETILEFHCSFCQWRDMAKHLAPCNVCMDHWIHGEVDHVTGNPICYIFNGPMKDEER